MPRQRLPLEFNKFIGGLNTDASPLTSVPNSSLDEQNYLLNIDGSRRRRLGMDYEPGFTKQATTIDGTVNPSVTSYKWKNAGGIPDQSIGVVQIGKEIKFYNLESTPVSPNLIYTYTTSATDNQNFSYATVDGILVVATGAKTLTTFTFASPSTITANSVTLYIRDFFGVQDVISGTDLFDGQNVQIRPTSKPDPHLYNLRNQTWGLPRILSSGTTPSDPISDFFAATTTLYPSNSDNLNQTLYPDPNSAGNKTVDRFWAINLRDDPLGTERTPSGYFIIDALARGTDRLAKVQANNTRWSLSNGVTTLPTDTTPGGPTVVAGFAGRVFTTGFSGDVTGGDTLSPRMSSYILFSQVVNSINDIGRCYQVGDPTSKASPDLVATDGGYLRIDGAYGIKAMIAAGSSLLVFATNGVWRIVGGSDYGFSATNYAVEKISDKGVSSSDSLVSIDTSVMFWGADAIYYTHLDQTGSWVVENITTGKIQTLFDSISLDSRSAVRGAYDSYERKVKWLYYNNVIDTKATGELILDLSLKSFYKNLFSEFDNSAVPKVIGYVNFEPYVVTRAGTTSTHEIAYIIANTIIPVSYTFGYFKDLNFVDFKSEDNVGIDADAFVITSYVSSYVANYQVTNDFMFKKGIGYLFVHMNRTEDGFEFDDGGDLVPSNQSSCNLQTRWEWSDSNNSNRWARTAQVYRYKKLYMPVDNTDTFDTGFSTIVTRNRIRGYGKVVSFKFSTDPGKDCHIYGWSFITEVGSNA